MYNKIIYIVLILISTSCDSNNADYDCTLSELTNFSLEDKNPNSSTFEELIGPNFFPNTVRLFYFSMDPD